MGAADLKNSDNRNSDIRNCNLESSDFRNINIKSILVSVVELV
jgi:hypothetical protein